MTEQKESEKNFEEEDFEPVTEDVEEINNFLKPQILQDEHGGLRLIYSRKGVKQILASHKTESFYLKNEKLGLEVSLSSSRIIVSELVKMGEKSLDRQLKSIKENLHK